MVSWVRLVAIDSARLRLAPDRHESDMRETIVQLLHRLSIRSINGSEKLLKVIKNPITDHLPTLSHKISAFS